MTHPQPSPQIETPPASNDAPDAVRLAAALGRIPSGLFVVTWRQAGGDHGMLASWVMQTGFQPPLIALAVARSRDLFAAIEQHTPFVVNVLAESQRSLVGRFGKPIAPAEDPFAGLAIERTTTGTLAVADAAAWLECQPLPQPRDQWSNGDHAVVLARVVASGGVTDQQPIVHVRKNGLRY